MRGAREALSARGASNGLEGLQQGGRLWRVRGPLISLGYGTRFRLGQLVKAGYRRL